MEREMDSLHNTRELLDKSVKLLENSFSNDQPKFRHRLGKSFQPGMCICCEPVWRFLLQYLQF